MYEPDTILKRSKPVAEDDAAAPYNRVQVIAASPMVHPALTGWAGVQANGVLLRPLEGFAANLDEPLGKVQELYEIESVPERSTVVNPPVKVITPGTAGMSPEEVFADAAKQSTKDTRSKS